MLALGGMGGGGLTPSSESDLRGFSPTRLASLHNDYYALLHRTKRAISTTYATLLVSWSSSLPVCTAPFGPI